MRREEIGSKVIRNLMKLVHVTDRERSDSSLDEYLVRRLGGGIAGFGF